MKEVIFLLLVSVFPIFAMNKHPECVLTSPMSHSDCTSMNGFLERLEAFSLERSMDEIRVYSYCIRVLKQEIRILEEEISQLRKSPERAWSSTKTKIESRNASIRSKAAMLNPLLIERGFLIGLVVLGKNAQGGDSGMICNENTLLQTERNNLNISTNPDKAIYAFLGRLLNGVHA